MLRKLITISTILNEIKNVCTHSKIEKILTFSNSSREMTEDVWLIEHYALIKFFNRLFDDVSLHLRESINIFIVSKFVAVHPVRFMKPQTNHIT